MRIGAIDSIQHLLLEENFSLISSTGRDHLVVKIKYQIPLKTNNITESENSSPNIAPLQILIDEGRLFFPSKSSFCLAAGGISWPTFQL